MAIAHGGNIFSVAASAGVPWQQVLDFSASINPLGPSAAAREAILAAMDRIAHYPERTGRRLRERLSAEWCAAGDKIVVGNGSTELLFEWCRFVGTGTIAAPAFGEFHRAWPNARLCDLARAEEWPVDGPVVLTRPANPTGVLLEAGTILRYARGRRDPVLVDESFIDFCEAESLTRFAGGNLFVLRSLTKFWALPGLRVGALVGDVQELERTRPPWSVNALAEAAALAALDDVEHARRTKEFVRNEAAWLAGELRKMPAVAVWTPTANFIYVETPHAAGLTQFAAERRVLVRNCSEWPGLGRAAIRVAVRRRWENSILLGICKEGLCDA